MSNRAFILRRLGFFLLVATPLLPSLRAQELPTTSNRRQRFSVSGTVRDAQTKSVMENIKVDLRAASGEIVTSVFTTATGSFIFNNIGSGGYTIEISQIGYAQVRQQASVGEGPLLDLDIGLRRLNEPQGGGTQGGIISARDLSIPHKARAAMDKGVQLLYDKSDFAGSLPQFQRALNIYPGYFEAHFQMAVAYIQMQEEANAERELRQAIEINPKYAEGYRVLAMLLNNEMRFSDAEPAARKAVEGAPEAATTNIELARALYGLDRYEEAEPCLRKVIEKKPETGQAYLMLANVYIRFRNFPALLEDLNAYLKMNPSGEEADHARDLRDKVQALANRNVTATAQEEPSDASNDADSLAH